jgi:phosphonate transport system permease protein
MSSPTVLKDDALPSRKWRAQLIHVSAVVLFLVTSFAYLDMNPFMFVTEFHYVADLVEEMLPPSLFVIWQKAHLWSSVGETFAMAFLGTFVGALLAFILALFTARNTTPHPWICGPMRTLLGAQRAAPDFAIMLVIVVAVGFGPFAGTIALVIGSTGMFGKLFADAIEQIDLQTLESLEAVGSSRLQIVRFAIVPEVAPSFIANTLYLFEINVGSAVALGVFGGGGLGFELHIANSTLNYPDLLAYIVVITAMMVLVERVSDFLRKRIFQTGGALK